LKETYAFDVDDVDDAALLELAEYSNGLQVLEVQNVCWLHREIGHWRKLSAAQTLLQTFLSNFMTKSFLKLPTPRKSGRVV